MPGGLDHIVHCTADFEVMRMRMMQAGFTLTPPAEHPFGTGNSLVQLDGFFLEFLYVPNPHLVTQPGKGELSFSAYNAGFMQDGAEGCSMLVFEADDIAEVHTRFKASSLTTYKPFEFSRKAKQPDGEEVTVGFSLAFTTHPDMPRVVFFYCQQHAPQYFWKQEYQHHANTAVSIGEVAMVADQPLHYVEFLQHVSGVEAALSEEHTVRIETPRGTIAIYQPGAFEQAYAHTAPSLANGPVLAGYRIEVINREVALNHLDDAGIVWRDTPSGHAIGPDVASGAVIAFSEVY